MTMLVPAAGAIGRFVLPAAGSGVLKTMAGGIARSVGGAVGSGLSMIGLADILGLGAGDPAGPSFAQPPYQGPVMTGQPGVAVGGAMDRLGRPMMVQAQYASRIQCPPGYVAVTLPDGARVCALKGPARAAGLYKSRRKPPISAGDWRVLQKSDRVLRRVSKIAVTTRRVTAKKKKALPPRRRKS